MMSKEHLLTLLRINGLSATSDDESIRAVLTASHISEAEANSLLADLRGNVEQSGIRTDGLHKVFYTDMHLGTTEVSKLLGINIDLNVLPKSLVSKYKTQHLSLIQVFLISLVSLLCATSGILFYMYFNDTGLFHPAIGMLSARV